MPKIVNALVLTAALAALPVAVAHADAPGSYTIRLGDQTWTGTTAMCRHGINAYAPNTTEIHAGLVGNGPGSAYAQVDGATFDQIQINDDSGAEWIGFYEAGHPQRGQGTAVVNGNSYQLTGTVLKNLDTGGTVSSDFEFDATCP